MVADSTSSASDSLFWANCILELVRACKHHGTSALFCGICGQTQAHREQNNQPEPHAKLKAVECPRPQEMAICPSTTRLAAPNPAPQDPCMPHPHPHQSLLGTQPFSPHVVPTPRLVFWESTGGCNLRCVHCRRQWDSAPPDELTTDEAKRLIIDAISDSGWGSILVLSGGEPLMRPDLYELLEHCRAQAVTPALATNATLINDSVAARLASLGLSRVSVSLDGAQAATHDAFRGSPGSFDLAVSGIRSLRSAGIDVQINVTLTKRNRDEATPLLDLVVQLGACALHVFLLVPVGCGVDLPEEIRLGPSEVEQLLTFFDSEGSTRDLEIRATCAPQAQRIRAQRARDRARRGLPPGRGLAASSKGCLAGGGVIFIDAVGKVFPCGYLPVQVGDIRAQPLGELIKTSSTLASMRDTSLLKGRCAGCEFAPSCGGCRARAFGTTGELFGEEPSCPMVAGRSSDSPSR
jgi:AdoMet-dependent heme synthase